MIILNHLPPPQIAIYDATKRKKNLPQSTTAGLDLISRDLGAHTRTLQDVKAGSCVRESLEREAHRQVCCTPTIATLT